MNKNKDNLKIAVITSLFNLDITKKLQAGALEHLKKYGVAVDNIKTYEVPGAIELPLTAQIVAQHQKYDAIILLGAIIKGETDHYQWVCQQVSYGCQKVALDHSIPVIFGVLTTENEEQALERVGGKHGHKGAEAAETALSMIDLIHNISVNKKQFRGFL